MSYMSNSAIIQKTIKRNIFIFKTLILNREYKWKIFKGDRLLQLTIYYILFLLSYDFLVVINKSFNLFLVPLIVNFLIVEK